MRYKYATKALASTSLDAKTLHGLPKDISLLFPKIHVRFHRSEEMKNFFYCTLAIPAFKDDEGYVFEREFSDEIVDEDNIDLSTYSCPLNDHNFVSVLKHVTCHFEERNEMGQRMLLLFLRISGTPFFGYVLLKRNMYVENKS